MFSKIIKKGSFTLKDGVKSKYDYDYSLLSDSNNRAYCRMLNYKLEKWQLLHGKLNIVAGIETEGIRIALELSEIMKIPFILIPHEQSHFYQLEIPKLSSDTHWLIVDDIVTTGQTFVRALNYLDIEEKPESATFACMIRRNPATLDYSGIRSDRTKSEFHIIDRRFDFIGKRLVSLFNEPE